MTKPRALQRLEDEPLWVEANALAEFVYALLPELPEDEKWDTALKLRTAANNLIFSTAEALGNGGPSTMEYEWGDVRKYASALKTMYRFAGRQEFIDFDPSIMVRLNKFLTAVGEELSQAYERTAKSNADELEAWRDRYALWKQKTQDT